MQKINMEGKQAEWNLPTVRVSSAGPVAESCLTLCAENISVQNDSFQWKVFFFFGMVNKVRA